MLRDVIITEELADQILSFLEGFEDDPVQDGIDDLTLQLRLAIEKSKEEN